MLRHVARLITLPMMLMVGAESASAFETDTHGLITYNAYKRSALFGQGDPSVRHTFGLDRLPTASPFTTQWSTEAYVGYFDNFPVFSPYRYPPPPSETDYIRLPHEYERCQMRTLQSAGWFGGLDNQNIDNVSGTLSIQNWLIRGAIREDDLRSGYKQRPGCDVIRPDNDPRGNIMRVLNHFYDPVHDLSLAGGYMHESKSVDWALGLRDSFAPAPVQHPVRENHFSYADARHQMWLALTDGLGTAALPYTASARETDAEHRLFRWATVFRSLGDVVHLLQDGAQPQHVRDDAHSPFQSPARQAYEAYTNWRVMAPGILISGYDNTYLTGFYKQNDQIRPPIPVLGNYPIPTFSTPLRFFTTRQQGEGPEAPTSNRHGLMDYTNRTFFTAGTLPQSSGDAFLQPPAPIDETQGYVRSSAPCRIGNLLADRLSNTRCVHWTRPALDTVAPGYADTLPPTASGPPFAAPPMVTESALGLVRDILGTSIEPRYAIGLEELETMGNLGVPRAIAYSAGLIDYFFRGRLTLSAPPDGLFGVLDQGTPHTVLDGVPLLDDGSNRTFGFTTIRVRARNSTGDENGRLIESATGRVVPQTMRGGRDSTGDATGMLVAIARYHRNPCYRRDLSGEYVFQFAADYTPQPPFVPSGCQWEDLRSNVPEISVSRPLYVDAGGNLPGVPAGSESACANVGNINTGAVGNCEDDSALLEFDFADDPIPANATDLFLQVAYRGPLGDEQDGIAVGAIDLIEPQYFTSWNHTDWYLYEDQWLRPENAPDPPGAQEAASVSLERFSVCFGQQLIGQLPLPAQLAPAEFVRIAYLTDRQTAPLGTVATFPGGPTVARAASEQLTLPRQSDREYGGIFDIRPWYYGRGTTLGMDTTLYYKVYTGSWWNYSFPQAAALLPPIGSAAGPGVPVRMTTAFAGAPAAVCQAHFPPIPAQTAGLKRRIDAPDGRRTGGIAPEAEQI